MDQLVSAELLTALCHLGGADLSTPVAVLWECEDAFDFAGHDDCTSMFDFTFGPPALAHQLPLGSWIAIAAARMGLPHLLWAALTWAHTWDDSVAGVDWGPDPGIGGDLVGQQAQDEFEAYMRKVHRIRQNSVLGLALWRQAVIARPANIESEVWAAGLCGRMLMYMRPPLGCAAGRALAMTVIHQPQALQQEQEFMSSLALSLRSGVARLQQLRANGVQVQRQTYAAAFQQNEMFAQSAMDFQQTIALLYADPETVAQEQRSWGVMRGYCQAAPGTSLCAFTEHDVAVAAQYITQNLTQQRWEPKAHVVNSTALLMLRSLRTGLWQFHQRLNEQQVTRLLGVVSAGGTPAVQEGARADALAAARQAAAAVPEGLIATAARACASAALEYGGEMAGAAGWALRRRRCAEAAGSAGGAARAVREVLAGAAVEPLACALAEALIEQRFARMAMTAAAEAFGSTAPAMAAVSAAINLGLHASTFSCACSLLLTQPLPPLIL